MKKMPRGKPIECKYCKEKFKIQIDRKELWAKNKFICPHCGINLCILPPTERDLQIIQDKYRINRDEKYLKEMHFILLSYAESIIKKHYINQIQDKDLLSYYAQSAVSLLIESDYYKKDNFYIEVSFGSRLQKKCLQAIQGVKESIERGLPEDSLDFILEDGHVTSYEDTKKTPLESIEQDEEKFLLLQKFCDIIFEIGETCENKRENYIRLLLISNYLTYGEKALDFFDLYGRYGKYKTLKSLDIMKSEIQKILTLDYNNICPVIKNEKEKIYFVNNPLPMYDSFRIYNKNDSSWIMSKREWSLFYNPNAEKDAKKECAKMNKNNN